MKKEVALKCLKNSIWFKVIITLLVIVAFRFLRFIPLVTINIGVISKLMQQAGVNDYISLFAFNFWPYLSACIILQVASIFIPPLKRLHFSDESARLKLVMLTMATALIIAFIQGLNVSAMLYKDLSLLGALLIQNKTIFILVSALSFTAGLFILIWLAEIINKWGIGNGIPILIVSSIAAEMFSSFKFIQSTYKGGFFSEFVLMYLYIAIIVLILFYNFVTELQRRVYINYESKDKIIKTKTFIPIRNTWVARMPISIGIGIIWLPFRYLSYYENETVYKMAEKISSSNIIYAAILFALILVLTYLYKAIIYKPQHVIKLMKKYKANFENVRDKNGLAFLKTSGHIYALGSALFLFFVAMLPTLAHIFLDNQPVDFNKGAQVVISLISGVGLLILIGVITDIKRQFKAYIKMKKSDIKDWSLCYTSIDEIEANIKKGFLESKGIPAVIMPYQFTWGLPIRTAIDKFEVYVGALDRDLARDYLKNQ
jgi:preprotein translocase subunit SecY